MAIVSRALVWHSVHSYAVGQPALVVALVGLVGVGRSGETFNSVAFGCISSHFPNPHPNLSQRARESLRLRGNDGCEQCSNQRGYGVVNNAANRIQGPFLEQTNEDWRATAAVNLDGPIFASRAVLPGMVERGWGRIVNYSGVSAYRGGGALKAAVKLGIVGFTRGLAREFGKHGITVNAIAPSAIQGERDPGTERDVDISGIDSKMPIPRFGQPEEVAALVVYLSSKHAGFVTGQTYHINGGDVLQ